MKTGSIWQEAETHNVYLFDTVDHFGVTMDVLDGDWKLERDWIGRHDLWKEVLFDSFVDYAVFNRRLEIGKWHD